MKKILAFGASSSRNSINRTFANYTANLMSDVDVRLLDLNDYEMPIFSIDRQNESGIHQFALQFKNEIKKSDGIVISLAEHNGSYTAAFKNIFDWISRIDKNIWDNKPMFLLATAPGPRGGKSVLETAAGRFKRGNSNVILTYSLPSYGQNFSIENGITNKELRVEFIQKLKEFENLL